MNRLSDSKFVDDRFTFLWIYIGSHEVFIRAQDNLLDICPIRITAFSSQGPHNPIPRVQIKEVLTHTFHDVVDYENKLEISIIGKFFLL